MAIIYAIRRTATAKDRHHQPIRITVRPLLHGQLGRLMIGVTAFEVGNCATAEPGHARRRVRDALDQADRRRRAVDGLSPPAGCRSTSARTSAAAVLLGL